MTPTPKRKKRRKNYYFTQVHEDAIVQYTLTEDRQIRTQLYVELIQPALSEMVDKITYTYKFTSLPKNAKRILGTFMERDRNMGQGNLKTE